MDIRIRTATEDDLTDLAGIEAECFPEAEAATEDDIRDRLHYYSDHFLILEEDGRAVSFVDGMVTDRKDLEDIMYEDASIHDPKGKWQMIFGVNTIPGYRKKGYAGTLIRKMIELAREQGREGLVLTCKDELVSYYSGFGFVSEGRSDKSCHGGVLWNQMRLRFDP